MYCSHCGKALEAAPFCAHCGQPAGTAPATPVSRIFRHLRTLGILWVVYAVYLLLHWLLVLPFLRTWMGGSVWMEGSGTWIYAPFHPSGWLLHFIAIAVVIRFILSLLVGYALLTRQSWGRIYAVIIAILTLIKPLWGTLLAIYTLWVLLGRDSGPEYTRLSQSGPVHPL
jgi:hypothetical protein